MIPKQPFWTSKVFWTLTLGFGFKMLQLAGIVDAGTSIESLVDGAVLLLALAFRWNADQALTGRAENGADVRKI